jgi:hypothetical protein
MVRIAMVLAAVALVSAQAYAQSTPVPGGANQIRGTSVTYPATAFNGVVRLKPIYFGPPRATDKTPGKTPLPAGTRLWAFEAILSNGSTTTYLDQPDITLADKDGITADNDYVDTIGANPANLVQASAARIVRFYVAPLDFVPDHLLYVCKVAKCQALRILLPPQPPAAAAT